MIILNQTTNNNTIEEDVILFAKVKPNAIIPSKRDEDMCYDIYACFDEDRIVIEPHTTKLIPSGIASACNDKYGISLRERGSNGSIGLKVSSGIIDAGFRAEWFLALTNTNNIPISIDKDVTKTTITEDFILYPYTKAVCQAKVEEVPKVQINEITYEELKNIPSQRGMGMLGSSNK